jgi:hypothetical protein
MCNTCFKCEHPSKRCNTLQEISHSRYALTAEAVGYLDKGSPEAQVHSAVPRGGISLADLKVLNTSPSARQVADFLHCICLMIGKARDTMAADDIRVGLDLQAQLGPLADVGFAQCKRLKWLDIDKSQGAPLVVRKVVALALEAFGSHHLDSVTSQFSWRCQIIDLSISY